MEKETNNDSQYPHIRNIHQDYYGERGQKQIDTNKTMFRYIYDRRHDFNGTAMESYSIPTSYDEFFRNIITRDGSSFYNLGVKPGEKATFLLPSHPYTYSKFYSLSMLGVGRNMVDLRTSLNGTKTYINEVESKYLLCLNNTKPSFLKKILDTTSTELVIVVPSPLESITNSIKRAIGEKVLPIYEKGYASLGSKIILPEEFLATGAKNVRTLEEMEAEYKPNKKSLYLHTSGTEGFPKTVESTDEAQNIVATQYEKSFFDLRENDRFLAIMPPWIYYGIMGFHMPLSLGMTVLPIPNPSSSKFDNLILDLKPNIAAGVPEHYQQLMDSPRINEYTDLTFFRVAACGGAPMTLKVEDGVSNILLEHGAPNRVFAGYSLSENNSVGTACQPGYTEPGTVGIPLPDISVMVIDRETKQPLKYGEEGILCINGDLMAGYLGREEETEDVFIEVDGKKYVITNDIGSVNERGFVSIVGRAKDNITRFDGFKVNPNELANKICQNKAVKNCVVFGVKDLEHTHGDLPIAYIELYPQYDNRIGREIIIREIKAYCKKELPEYYIPSGWYFGKTLYTSMMKDDRKEMKRVYEQEKASPLVLKTVKGRIFK